MGNINEALSLLVVGMIMVFIILILVIVVGQLVIQLTNRYLPEVKKTDDGSSILKGVNSKKMAAIAAVVDHITQGEGRLDTIQKK